MTDKEIITIEDLVVILEDELRSKVSEDDLAKLARRIFNAL